MSPPPLPLLLQPKKFQLDLTRPWPPVTSCSFTQNLTTVSYQGTTVAPLPATPAQDPAPPSPQPKGVMIFANSAVPAQSPSFYWEIEVCHLGDGSSDTAHIAMGYCPNPEKPPEGQSWSYPSEACLIRR